MDLRNAAKHLLLVVVSTLAALVTAEGLLRVAHGFWTDTRRIRPATMKSVNPVLLYEYRPGALRDYGLRSDPSYSEHVIAQINRFGFRDSDDIAQTAAGAEKRVAFVGDSVTEGEGVRNEDTFEPLAKLLSQPFLTQERNKCSVCS